MKTRVDRLKRFVRGVSRQHQFRGPGERIPGGPGAEGRRGVVAVQVMVTFTALMGAAALAADIGYMWNVRADLQRTADAASLASAAMLSDVNNPAQLARSTAVEYVARNAVMNELVPFAPSDVQLGRAQLVNGQYQFTEVADNEFPDAVRVTLQSTRGYFFGKFFGRNEQTMSASATALLVPRDIALVADLSASHNDDSELGSYLDTQINIWDVWDALPGGSDDAVSVWPPEDLVGLPLDPNGFHPQSAGPGYGLMRQLRYGQETLDATYDPTADPGLIHLPRWGTGNSDWNSPIVSNYLNNLRFQNNSAYSPQEIAEVLNTAHHAQSARYRRQVAVALGLARWDSGKPGGAWESIPGAIHGNGNNEVDSWEITWLEPYFNEPGYRWLDYIYWAGASTRMAQTNPDFRNAFGIKTFTNYLLERRWSHAQTPELAGTPAQPMQAVKDAVELMVNVVTAFDNDDQLALDVYGYSAVHRVPLVSRPNLDEVSIGPNGLSGMQAGYFDGWTNMGGGLQAAIETLTNPPARTSSHKMIVLLTDGRANITADGSWPHGSWADQQAVLQLARDYVIDQANVAASLGIRVFAVSVGAYADTTLMQEVADITGGEHLPATSNDITTYSAQLQEIFLRLGGQRAVELIN